MSLSRQPVGHESASAPLEAGRGSLWFGLLGGGVAWTVHFLLAYVIAEFGCLSGWGKTPYLGVTALAWLLLGISVLALLGAGTAFFVARRSGKALTRWRERESVGDRTAELYMARAGVVTNALFALIILVEALPIFFYLQRC